LAVSLTGSTANTGFAGTEATVFTGVGGQFAGIDTVTGSGDETLTGRNVASTWTVGTVNDGTETLSFSGIATAIGNAASDTLSGGAGIDTFTVDGIGSVALAGQDFDGMDTLNGQGNDDIFNLNTDFGGAVNGGANGANGDLIVGLAAANTFVVDSINGGTVNITTTFTDVENLTGGAAGDTFTVTALLSGSALGMGGNDNFDVGGTGSIGIVDGGTGTDSLSYTGRTAGVTVNMANVNAVESLTGSGFSDTFNFDGVEGNEITIVGGGGANDVVAVIGNTQIGGDLNVSDVDSVSIGADLDAGANDVNLAVDGAITQSGAGGLLTAQSLTVSSVGGQQLVTAVSSYDATNTGSGNINIDDTGDLEVVNVSQMGGGMVDITATGAVTQSGNITATGGAVNMMADGAITMQAGTITNSNGGDISYDNSAGSGGDITLGTLQACDNCPTSGGTIVITANGSILGNPGESHISAVSASLSAAGDIGAPDPGRINFVGMDPSADAGAGEEIALEFGGSAFVNEGLFNFTVSEFSDASKVDAQGQASANVASADQAASQDDEEDVDWAAFSEEVTVYEINNDGVQLPQGQQTDEFAKLHDEEQPVGIPVSQLID
jgi:hypothetical protein